MQNLAHSGSFHSKENIAPSKSGIKQLEYTAFYCIHPETRTRLKRKRCPGFQGECLNQVERDML